MIYISLAENIDDAIPEKYRDKRIFIKNNILY